MELMARVFFRKVYYKCKDIQETWVLTSSSAKKSFILIIRTSEWDQKHLLDTTKMEEQDWPSNVRSEVYPC